MTHTPMTTTAPAPLLGLTGAAGAGKDAVGNILKAAGWRGMAFADALRIEAAEAWALDIRLFVDRKGKDVPTPQLSAGWCSNAHFIAWCAYLGHSLHQPRSPRWVMQQWGSWRRNANPMYWVLYVEQWIAHQRRSGARGLVITDVRMLNEAAMVQWCGGHIVRVHRPGLASLPPDLATHESEGHTTIPADADLHNDGDLQHLAAEVARVLHALAPTGQPGNAPIATASPLTDGAKT